GRHPVDGLHHRERRQQLRRQADHGGAADAGHLRAARDLRPPLPRIGTGDAAGLTTTRSWRADRDQAAAGGGGAGGSTGADITRYLGISVSTSGSSSSIRFTSWISISLRGCSGISMTSLRLRSGRTTRLMPPRCAARNFSLMPPTGSTSPRSVISPVIATSLRIGFLGAKGATRPKHGTAGE